MGIAEEFPVPKVLSMFCAFTSQSYWRIQKRKKRLNNCNSIEQKDHLASLWRIWITREKKGKQNQGKRKLGKKAKANNDPNNLYQVYNCFNMCVQQKKKRAILYP